MPWIKQIPVEEATGLLKRQFDAAQVVGYFNYINRVAESLGVDPEDFIRPWGEAK